MLRILIVEDVPSDAALVERELRHGGLESTTHCVETEPDFVAALADFKPDIVLSDYNLPTFNGMDALRLVQQRSPTTPLIIVTGSLSEETAAECIKAGAADYVLKERLARLPVAVRGALERSRLKQDKRRAEEALRHSEAELRAFFNAGADGIFVKDAALRTVMANPAYAAFLGRPVEEILGRDDFELMPDAMARACRESDLDALRRKIPCVTEEEADGRVVESRKFPVALAEGSVGVGGYIRDVTEVRQTEEALRKSREIIEGVLDAIPARIFWKDRNLVYLGCNAIFARDAGFAEAKDLIGKDDYQMGWHDQAEAYRADDRQVIESGCSKILKEEPQTTPEGKTITLLTSKLPLRDSNGEISGLLGTYLDITDRKQVENDLRSSEARFRSYFELPLHGIGMSSVERRWTQANDRLCSILGYSRDEFLKMTWTEMTHPEDLEADVRSFDRILSGEIDHYDLEKRFIRKDGTIIWTSISVGCVRKPDGGVDYLVVLVEDISEKKAAEEALRASEERYRLIAENTADVIWTLDLATRRFTYMSPSVERLRGYSAEEVLAQPFEASMTPDSARRVNAHLAAALAAFAAGDRSAATTTVEVDQPTRDGGIVQTEIVANGLVDASGRLTSVLGVTRNITEWKRAQAALRESEERYRSLFEQSPIGVYRTTPDGEILLANPALITMLGYLSLDELRARNLEEGGFEPHYLRDAFKDVIKREGKVRGFEAVWTTKEGRRVHVRENAHAIRDTEGKILYHEGAVEDITAERETREALRRSEAQYRQLFESSNDAIMVFEPETETILDVNPKACELYGLTRDELIGTSLKRLTVDVARGEKRIADLRRSNQVQTFETIHLHRDGTPVDLEVSLSAIDYGGHVAVLGTARDITQRKQSEEERKRLVAAIEQSGEAVVITDRGGVILYVNPAFEWITGYRADEVIGLNPRVLKSGKQDPRFYAEMWATITHGSVWTGRLSNRRKDGSLYEEEMSVSPIRDENGTVINYVAVKRDVTTELELQQQLAQAQKMEAVGRLAGGVAHDFNNLLQALISHVELLRSRSNDPEKVVSSSREMEQLIGHGASLTRQLLLFSRRETVKPERLNLNEQVREASKMLKRLVKDNITLRVELAPESLRVNADRGQLDQVLMNLVVNASDAMPDGGELTIRTGSTNDMRVWLSVEDTGIGIPEDIRERIFEPFFTTKGVGKGTGLGLSVVHGIVTRHGGRIEVASGVGLGTTFKVILPAAGSGEFPAAKEGPKETAELPVGKGERILVVEDEELARQGLHDILVSFNYKVVSVGSGEAAGSLPADPPFDLLLTDLMLPGVAGPQLAIGLKERWPALKVILMSGYTEDETIRSGVGDGTLRFLQKPFDMATLAREVRAALDG